MRLVEAMIKKIFILMELKFMFYPSLLMSAVLFGERLRLIDCASRFEGLGTEDAHIHER